MANHRLFCRDLDADVELPVRRNEAGGRAYELSPEQALAQYAATGCLNGTFYATDQQQLATALGLARECDPGFLARAAVFAREQGAMKDLPALLCAVLAVRDGALLAKVFPRVIDTGRMLRSFVQIVRSGKVGRRSLGTLPRRLVRQWLAARTEDQLLDASIGNAPSLADVVRMVHPKPANPVRENFHRWLLGRPFDLTLLPERVQALEWFKLGIGDLPDVSFQFLASLRLDAAQWRQVAERASWTTLRLHLNTFLRHGVFACAATTAQLAGKLADPAAITQSLAFPYQLMTTLSNLDPAIPVAIRDALERALEHAVGTVPVLPGRTVVAVDVSGSMDSPVTGHRPGSTTKATCRDVAALFAAAVLRANPTALVIPFHRDVCDVQLDPTASVLATAQVLRSLPSGGTNCSAVLAWLNRRRIAADTVVYFSDDQSWMDTNLHGEPTATLAEWRRFKRANPTATMVGIDLQPYRTVQAPVADDVVHVGGFSDHVFEVLRAVAMGQCRPDLHVARIREVAL